MDYKDFLKAKIKLASFRGFDVSPEEINPGLKPHTRDIVRWAVQDALHAIKYRRNIGLADAIAVDLAEFAHSLNWRAEVAGAPARAGRRAAAAMARRTATRRASTAAGAASPTATSGWGATSTRTAYPESATGSSVRPGRW